MDKLRTFAAWASALVLLSALVAVGAKAQGPYFATVEGSFTLPFEVVWGTQSLPAGDYTFVLQKAVAGWPVLLVRGTADQISPTMILISGQNHTKASKNMLICFLGAEHTVVRALELPVNGQTLYFPVPKHEQIRAHHKSEARPTQLAELRVPVKVSAR